MWTDGRTVTTKLIVTFRDFAKAPRNVYTQVRATQEPLQLGRVCCIFCATISVTQSPAFRKLAQVLRYSKVPQVRGIPRRSPIQLLTILKVS